MNVRPHDLIWIDQASSLRSTTELPPWVAQYWQTSLPLVIRRDSINDNFIPVGIRGMKRSQRLAATVKNSAIIQVVSPEELVAKADSSMSSPWLAIPAMQALIALKANKLTWQWGVTGSCGYQLATGLEVMTMQSDLDLLVRCPYPVQLTDFLSLAELIRTLACRVDVQIETPYGGFALNEWLREGRVMLKTATGPLLTANPWQLERVG